MTQTATATHIMTNFEDRDFTVTFSENMEFSSSPGANSDILHFISPNVQHRFDVFFYILGLWANDFKTLTKNKSVRKSYYRAVLT